MYEEYPDENMQGRPLAIPCPSKLAAALFWLKVDVRTPDECWLWRGSAHEDRNSHVRGRLARTDATGRTFKYSTNRYAYAIAYKGLGPMRVYMRCGNTLCCNPRHITTMMKYANPSQLARRSKLTPTTVRDIRQQLAAGAKLSAIARKYDVSCSAIAKIRDRVTWKWA